MLRPQSDCELAFEAKNVRRVSIENHRFLGGYETVTDSYSVEYLWADETNEAA